jgi:ankyrin repeat protein
MRKENLSVGLLACALLVGGAGFGCGSGGGEGGASSGGGGTSAVYDAANVGDDAAIRTAVQSGVDVDAPGRAERTGLFIAVYNKNVRTAQTLLDLGADPAKQDKNGKSALMYAASRGYNDLLRNMIAKKPNLNLQDRTGYTAAHHAATMGNKAGFDMLKAAGADLTLTDKRGLTAADLMAAKEQSMGATTQPAM